MCRIRPRDERVKCSRREPRFLAPPKQRDRAPTPMPFNRYTLRAMAAADRVRARPPHQRMENIPARTKYQSGSYGASSFKWPVFTISTHFGSSMPECCFRCSAYAWMKSRAATSRTVAAESLAPIRSRLILLETSEKTALLECNQRLLFSERGELRQARYALREEQGDKYKVIFVPESEKFGTAPHYTRKYLFNQVGPGRPKSFGATFCQRQ